MQSIQLPHIINHLLKNKIKLLLGIFCLIYFGFLIFDSYLHFILFSLAIIFSYCIVKFPASACFIIILISPISRLPGPLSNIDNAKFILYSAIILLWLAQNHVLIKQRLKLIDKHSALIPFRHLLIIFGIFIGLTTLVSTDIQVSIIPAIHHLLIITYFFYFTYLLRNQKIDIETVFQFLVIIAGSIALLAILQFAVFQLDKLTFLKRLIIPGMHREFMMLEPMRTFGFGNYRSCGTFYHPNLLGIYLSMIFPLSVSMALISKKRIMLYVNIVMSVMIFGGIFCSASRAAIFTLISTSLLFIVCYFKKLKPALMLFVLIICALFLITKVPNFSEYMRIEKGLSGRETTWKNAVVLIKQRPFMGWGLGTIQKNLIQQFGFSIPDDLDIAINEIDNSGTLDFLVGFNAHNVFLNYAVEMGIAAAFIIFYLYYLFFKRWILFEMAHKRIKNERDRILILGSAVAVAGTFLYSFFESRTNFNLHFIGIIFILLVASALHLMNDRKISDETKLS